MAYYNLYETPDPTGKGERKPLHARAVIRGKITAKELCHEIANGTTLSTGEVAAVFSELEHKLLHLLDRGHSVELGNIGTVSLVLKARPVMEKSEIRAQSVKVSDITLRTSKAFRRELAGIRLERFPTQGEQLPIDDAERDRLLSEFFANEKILTRRIYQHLRRCSKRTALKELRELVDAGRLIQIGQRVSTAYMRP